MNESAVAASVIPLALKVHYEGVTGDLLKNVTLRVEEKQKSQRLDSVVQLKQFYHEIPREIKRALEPYGYFESQVISHLKHKNNQWDAYYQISKGPPMKIKNLDLKILGEGGNDKGFRRALQDFSLKKGQIFEAERYESAKIFLFSTAAEYGYPKAVLKKKKVVIDRVSHSAEVNLYFDTGIRYVFGPVSFSKTPFRADFLKKWMTFKRGETYSQSQLRNTQEALNNSNYFREINVVPRIPNPPKREVPVMVKLIPRKAKQYSAGVGYGTDTGVRFSFGMDRRYVNDRGHYWNSQLLLSMIRKKLETHYIIPGNDLLTQKYDLSGTIETLNENQSRSQTLNLAAAYMASVKSWQRTLKLAVQRDNYRDFGKPLTHSFFLLPSMNWYRVDSNDPVKPTRGYSINFNVQGASRYLLSSTNFLQATLAAKRLIPVTQNTYAVLRGTVGNTWISDLDDLPLSLQFLTGGMQSVRGYGYNTIGPGRTLTIGSAEWRYRIKGDWYAVTFVDAGSVDDQWFKNFKKSIGVGAVWRSPVGSIEVVIARALDLPGKPYKLQFNIGAEL